MLGPQRAGCVARQPAAFRRPGSPTIIVGKRCCRRKINQNVRRQDACRRPAAPPAAAGGWSGRFAEPVTELVKRYTASVGFDRRLAVRRHRRFARPRPHARGDRHPAARRTWPTSSAASRRSQPRSPTARSRGRSTHEDVHLNIERRLTALVGDAGKRLHTGALAQRPGRHRRAAVAARRHRRAVRAAASALRRAFIDLAEQHADTIMPGFTHLQVAQPVTFGHHLHGVRRDVRARRRAPRRLPQAREPPARSAPPRSPAPRFRSTARASRASSGFDATRARIRSTPCATAISRSNSKRPRRSS